MPNGNIITSESTTTMKLPDILHNARIIHFFPGLKSHSLISISQLCDAGCQAHFDKHFVRIVFKNEVILKGSRDPTTKLWMLPIELANNHDNNQRTIYQASQTKCTKKTT